MSDAYLFYGGERWARLPAHARIIPGDRTGITKPGPNAPDGGRVRKSRHVWRRAQVLPEMYPEMYPETVPDPDTCTDSDGRPWRRLESGTKIRKCDRWGDTRPTEETPRGNTVMSDRCVWRPTGPPTYKTKAPHQEFLDYLQDCECSVSGYSFKDLLQYLESVKS